MAMTTPAHDQRQSHVYMLHFPAHFPRLSDPHYLDFEAFRRANVATAHCYAGERAGLASCRGGLELHHAVIEFAVQNAIDLAALERDYPGVSNPAEVGAWVESGKNLRFLCEFHHRGTGGAHTASHSDWIAQLYVPGFIS